MRGWLNAVDALLSENVGDKARATLAAVRGVTNPDAAETAVNMFTAAMDADRRHSDAQARKAKTFVDDVVIPDAHTDTEMVEAFTAAENEALADQFAWTVMRRAAAHGHATEGVTRDECPDCWTETVELYERHRTPGPEATPRGTL